MKGIFRKFEGFFHRERCGNIDKRDWKSFFRTAAEMGDATAQFNLGFMFETGCCGFPQNDMIAHQWYSRAAVQGHPEARKRLGSLGMKIH